MGLDVSVGDLVQLAQDDPELLEDIAEDFARLSRTVAATGHGEFSARQLPDEALFSSRVGSYGTLHYLRRIAAHLWKEDRLPQPGGDEASDRVLDECYAYLDGGGRDTGFDHLIYHRDCEGYYVPIVPRKSRADHRSSGDGTVSNLESALFFTRPRCCQSNTARLSALDDF